jgi:hypothetical protein
MKGYGLISTVDMVRGYTEAKVAFIIYIYT